MTTPHAPPAVDLIIPARNEEANLPALLAALPRPQLRWVVVVDNGSTDRTAQLARAGGANVVREDRPGYGAACLAGIHWLEQRSLTPAPPTPSTPSRAATSPQETGGGPLSPAAPGGSQPPTAVAFIDADLADDPAELPRLTAPILRGEADLVVSNRGRGAQRGALSPHQRFGCWLACRLICLATGRRYHDLGPMRVVHAEALRRMNMRDRTWGWTVEMQFKAAAMGLRVVELDVPYRRRRAGRSKISGSLIGSVRAGWRIIATIARLWWRHR